MTSKQYMANIYNACGDKLVNGGLYSGKDGHLRLAREIGYALNEFDAKGQRDILSGSYSIIYVRACFLKPMLNAKEWMEEITKGWNKVKVN